ncbi:MAG: glycosyltransferase family 39 protein [Verrucomicrobiota bacterium]
MRWEIKRKESFGIWIVCLLVGATALRLFMLSHQSFWTDEGLTLIRTDASDLQVFWSQLNSTLYDKYQPTYFVLLFFWRKIFGDSVTAIRSLSVVFSVFSIVFTTLASSKLYGERQALWTAGILSFSAFHVYYSQEARAYALVLLIASLEFYLFCDVLTGRRRVPLTKKLLFWLVVAAGCLSSVFIFIFTLSLCFAHLFVNRGVKDWLNWWMPLVLCVLPALFFYWTSPTVENSHFSFVSGEGSHLLKENFPFVAYGLLAGVTYLSPPHQLLERSKLNLILSYWPHILLLLSVVVIILLALGRILLTRTHIKERSSTYKATLFLAIFIVVAFSLSLLFAMRTGIHWIPRHSSFIFPAIALLIPATFCRSNWPHGKTPLIARAAKLSATLLIILNVYSLQNYFFNTTYAREDYRAAAQYIKHQSNSEIASVLLGGNLRLLHYYGATKTIMFTSSEVHEHPGMLKKAIDHADEILVSIYRGYRWQFSVEALFGDSYRLEDKEEFQHITVYKLKRK